MNNERAQAIPDVTFRAGYRRFEELDDHAFVAGISVPLPLFNRNSGRITNTTKKFEANQAEHIGHETAIQVELDTLTQAREILIEERDAVSKHLLPDSQKALKQVREAYQLGKIGYLDLIDFHEVYFKAKEREIRNLFELKSNEVTIKAITGEILDNIKEGTRHE